MRIKEESNTDQKSSKVIYKCSSRDPKGREGWDTGKDTGKDCPAGKDYPVGFPYQKRLPSRTFLPTKCQVKPY